MELSFVQKRWPPLILGVLGVAGISIQRLTKREKWEWVSARLRHLSASEVRSLAQRSSSAAKEIKDLITASVQKIHDGSTLAGEAGRMFDVTQAVARVTDIMGEIAAASRGQSRGIEQVNLAITQMDEGTLQNAALVEEAAGTSKSLEGQGRQLTEAVAFFRLDGAPNSQPVRRLVSRVPAGNAALSAGWTPAPVLAATRAKDSGATDWQAF